MDSVLFSTGLFSTLARVGPSPLPRSRKDCHG
jgi:hypothetical protein